MNILKKIDKYNKKNIINKKLNIKKKYNINFDKEDKKKMIILEGNKKILVGTYIFFGIYQPENKLWIWSSSIHGVNQEHIKKIKEIRSASYLFEQDNEEDILFIYQLLTNDIIKLSDINKFNLINKVLNYLSDSIFIFNPSNKIGNVQFIGLHNITEEYL